MQEGKRENFVKELKDKQEKIRIKHENKESKLILPLADSRAKGISFDWNEQEIAEPLPERLGLSQIKAELKEVLQFFDWSPFSGLGNYGASIRISSITKSLGMKPRNCMIAPKNSSIGF